MNKKGIYTLFVLLILALVFSLMPGQTLAQDVTCDSDVVVQADDWLSKISEKFYGDVLAFPAIAQATNAIAADDNSYTTIENVDLIEVGWRLCVPSTADAEAMLNRSISGEAMAPVEPIRVGSTIPLTGFLAQPWGGIHPLIGDLFLKRLNESGGLLGRPVEWITLDDESSPAKAAELYERLLTEEKVDLIIGTHGNDSNLAAMQVAEQHRMMVLPHHGGGVSSTFTYERHFPTFPTGSQPNITHADRLFEALESSGTAPKTVAFVISQYELDQFMAHGYEGAGGAVDVAKGRGYEVVLEVEYPAGTTDFSAIAAQVKDADADFLYVLGVGLDSVNLIKALQALDYHPPAIYPAFSPQGPLLGTGENVFGLLAFAPHEPYLSYPDAAWLNEAYTTAATEAGLRNTTLENGSAAIWAVWQVLVAGVEGAGSLDQTAITDWLQHNEVQTILGPLTFDPEHNNASADSYAIGQVQDHKWVIVYPSEFATTDYTVQYSPGE